MRCENKIFDGKYFAYSVRKIFPFFISSNVLMLIATAFVYFSKSTASFLFGEVYDYSAGAVIFLYIYPMLLGTFLFRFLFSKKQSDLIGSVPVKRSAVFFTNIIIGAAACLVTSLAITALSCVETEFFIGNNMYTAPQIYLETFLFWFIAYFAVFAVTVLAATLSGKYVTHLMLTAVFLFSPAVAEISLVALLDAKGCDAFFLKTGGILYMMLVGERASFGSLSYMAFLLVFAAAIVALGCVFFKKRKFEVAENGYANRAVKYIVRFGIYLPASILLFMGEYYGAFLSFLFLLIAGFVIGEVLLNKGFKKEMLKGLAVVGVSVLICAIAVYSVSEGSTLPDNFGGEIVSVTVKIPRYNQISPDLDTFGSKTVSVKVDKDSELFDLLANTSTDNGKYSVEIDAEFENADGVTKKKTFYRDVTDEGFEILAEYLEKDAEFVGKFYWEDFPEKPQTVIYSTEGLVLKSVPFSLSEQEKDFVKDLESAVSNTNTVGLGDGTYGVYFVSNRYYLRKFDTTDADITVIREYLNSEASFSKDKLCEICLTDESGRDIDFVKDTSSVLKSELVFSALKKSDGPMSERIAVKVNGRFNSYSAVFVDEDALCSVFAEYYDSVISSVGNDDFEIYYLSGIFEKYYDYKDVYFGNKTADDDCIEKLRKYFVKWDDVSSESLGYVYGYCFGQTMRIYFSLNEETEEILQEMELTYSDFRANAEKIISITVDGVEITDGADVEYLGTSFLLDGSSSEAKMVCEGDEYGVITYCFTDNMRSLLSEKYGISPTENSEVTLDVLRGFEY